MNTEKSSQNESIILIVDDQIENLQIIGNILKVYDLKKAIATNGYEALEISRRIYPDLILLDIMMPEIDGLQVCRKLKENPLTRHIPIIFLTAKTQEEDIVAGFEAGGVDYITKPFKTSELLSRVKTHLDLKLQKDTITEQNEFLKNLIKEKNELMAIAAHDLKNPLQVMVGFAKIIEERCNSLNAEDVIDIAKDIRTSGESMFRIITDLLDLNAAEENKVQFNIELVDLNELIIELIDQYRLKTEEKRIKIFFEAEQKNIYIESDPARLLQVLDNLLSNAIKFSPFDRNIYISSNIINENNENSRIRFQIQDEGPGIAPEDMDILFVKFARLRNRPTNNETSTRLGLSIVKKFLELMNGRVWCESEFGFGAKFIFELPQYLNLEDDEYQTV